MSLFKGSSGKISLKLDSGTESFLAHTTAWSVDSSMSIDETSYFGGSLTEEGVTEKVPGTIGWTGNIDGAIDNAASANQDMILTAHNNQSLVTVMFYLDATTAYSGEGYIDSLSFSDAADGKGEFTGTIAGNGTLQKVTVGGA